MWGLVILVLVFGVILGGGCWIVAKGLDGDHEYWD